MSLLRRFAFASWLLSLLTPVCRTDSGQLIFGLEFAAHCLLGVIFLFPYGLLAHPFISVPYFSNAIFFYELKCHVQRDESHYTFGAAIIVLCLTAINFSVLPFLHHYTQGLTSIPIEENFFAYPGVYFWLCSFALLSVSAIVDHSAYLKGLLLRCAIVFMVAAAIAIPTLYFKANS